MYIPASVGVLSAFTELQARHAATVFFHVFALPMYLDLGKTWSMVMTLKDLPQYAQELLSLRRTPSLDQASSA